jgi:hypothetical protein
MHVCAHSKCTRHTDVRLFAGHGALSDPFRYARAHGLVGMHVCMYVCIAIHVHVDETCAYMCVYTSRGSMRVCMYMYVHMHHKDSFAVLRM